MLAGSSPFAPRKSANSFAAFAERKATKDFPQQELLRSRRRVGKHRRSSFNEVLHVFESAIDAGETDVGHLIHLPQPLHHHLADNRLSTLESKFISSSFSTPATIASSCSSLTGRFQQAFSNPCLILA